MGKLIVLALSLTALTQQQEDDKKKAQEKSGQTEVIIFESSSPLKGTDTFNAPYNVDRISSSEIEGKLSRTVPEALKEIGGVSIQKTAQGHGSPFIRGFTGFRNVLLIDGIRLNNSVFRDGPNQYWNTVDEFLIDRLELIRGPASVLYGSDAIGGTVAVYTKEPTEFKGGFNSSERSFTRYAGAENSFTERVESGGNYNSLGFFTGITYRDFNEIQAADLGRLPRTGYDEYDADLKTVYRVDENGKIIFAYQRTRQDDVPRTHRTVFSKSWHGTTVGTDLQHDFDQERDLAYLQYKIEKIEHLFFDRGTVSLSWHRQAEQLRRITSTSKLEEREFEVNTPALWFQLGSPTKIGYFTYGFEFYRDKVSSDGRDRTAAGTNTFFDRGEVADDSRYDLMGIFVQDELTAVEKKLDFVFGGRYSLARAKAGGVDPSGLGAAPLGSFDERFDALVGSFRAVFHAGDQWNIVGGVSQGFRAPNFDDLTAVRVVMSGQTDFPNPDLDPEKSITYEIGVKTRNPQKYEGSLFAFKTKLHDLIRRVPAPDISPTAFRKDNFSKGSVDGIELEQKIWISDKMYVFNDFAWVVGKSEAFVGNNSRISMRPLPKVNPTMAHIGIHYDMQSEGKHWAEFLVTIADAQDRLSPEEDGSNVSTTNDFQRIPPGGTAGYAVYTARMGRKLSETTTLHIVVENITDKAYRIHGSGQNEPGTNFIIGFEARF